MTALERFLLKDFVAESNRIENIPTVRDVEVVAHEQLLAIAHPAVADVARFVADIGGGDIRDLGGMNVRVGRHYPPPGGRAVVLALSELLAAMPFAIPFEWHRQYETLHPFMDGNGRSGRALWLHMMGGVEQVPLGFLHTWYYQSLQGGRQ